MLRQYQITATQQISQGWRDHRRQVLALPTGAGKTFTFSFMAKLAAERSKTVIILTHRTELFDQTYKTFERIGIHPLIIGPDSPSPTVYEGVFVVMVETLGRRESLLENIRPDLIIIDECHVGNFSKIIDIYPESYVLGVTATPVGKHFEKYYTSIVQPIDTPDLIRDGFLMPYKAYQMADDFSDLSRGVSGDYSERSQFNHFNKSKLYDGLIDEWRRRCEGKKTIVFNCNIEHSNAMSDRFNACGIESYSITSKTPKKEREEILDRFHCGEFMVLNNASILTAGYDHPPIECVILNRATDSLPLFLQMIGRGSRPSEGKSFFSVLDFGGNHTRHGMWSQPREWSLKQKKRNSLGAAVVKDCPKCEAMLVGSASVCEYCGYVFPVIVKDLRTGVMVEYFEKDIPNKPMKDCTPDELAVLVKVGKVDRRKATAYMRRQGIDKLGQFGRELGYSTGWAWQQMKFLKR